MAKIKKYPPIAPLPIGTANEFSGCIGWSNRNNGKRLRKYLDHVRNNDLNSFDVWDISYDDEKQNEIMIAFLSFGFDAKICHQFHVARNHKKKQYSILESQLSYIKYGFKELFKPSDYINDCIEIFVDFKKIILPETRCLQILNINSMAKGIDFFGRSGSNSKDLLQNYKNPKFNDGILEVVATKSLNHMNKIRLNIGHSIRVVQGSDIFINIKKPIYMEVDGEAWLQEKSVYVRKLTSWPIITGNKYNEN